MYAITANNNKARLEKLDFTIYDNKDIQSSISSNSVKDLFTFPKSNFKAFIGTSNNGNSKLYYISYDDNDINIFSGYSNDVGELENTDNIDMTHKKISPLEFIDKVKLIDIHFIPYTQYVYYKLHNEDKNKNYFGIIDIELNKVIYNTDEQLTNFTPFSKNAMIATNQNSGYKICAIFTGGDCASNCPKNIFYDIENSNTCTDSYQCNKYKLIPNDICITTCDTDYYYLDNKNQCGLCRDFDFGKPYKMVKYEGCLSTKVSNTIDINEELKFISCKEDYSYINGICEFDCYDTCETCSEKSTNITDQKCLTCKSTFPILYKNNCLKVCPDKTYQEGNTCIECNESCLSCGKDGCTNCSPGLYLNNITHICEQCHPNCETCSGKGDDKNNNCNKCKNTTNVLINGTCSESCGEKKYKTISNTCEPCKAECDRCNNAIECTKCIDGYFLNKTYCSLCYENCGTCLIGGDIKNNNCSSCKNNLYLVKEGDYVNNCVERCPDGTVKDDKEKICKVGINVEENNESDLLLWIFIAAAGALFAVINIVFCCRCCCCKGKEEDEIGEIKTELSEMNLVND